MKKILLSIGLALLMITAISQASQHDYDIANAPGATVRADINNVLGAIATNNSGATAPTSTFANQWWMDTSTNLLKQRDNANSNWVTIGSKSGTTWIPYRSGTAIGTGATLTTDTDTALSANSDSNVATQKAVKTYADGKISKTTSGEISAMTEKTTYTGDDHVLIEDSASSNAKRRIKRSNVVSINELTEKTDVHDDDLFLIEDSESSNAKKKVKKSSIGSGLKLISTTSPSSVTNTGDISISADKDYLVVFQLEPATDSAEAMILVFNSDSSDHQYLRLETEFDGSPTSSDVAGSGSINLGEVGGSGSANGFIQGEFYFSTHDNHAEINVFVHGDYARKKGSSHVNTAHLNAIYSGGAVTSFEFSRATQAFSGNVWLYEIIK